MGVLTPYTLTFSPLAATLPIVTWDNGSIGPVASYRWSEAGNYTLAVTATSPCAQLSTTLAVTVFCQPPNRLSIAGPRRVPAGFAGAYTAAYTPITTSLPLTFTWDNGSIGPTAAYSWTTPGVYTFTVTGTNSCGWAQDTFSATAFCQPPTGLAVQGSATTIVDQPTTYVGAVQPITTSPPLTLTWSNGATGPQVSYSWPATGTYTLTVTATNDCGWAWAGKPVRVLTEWPYKVALPIVYK